MLHKCVVILCLATSVAFALDNGLARTPPMGWMSWLGFGCETDCQTKPKTCLSENLIKRTADRMVSDGYLAAGYEYIVIDDCWMEKERGPNGELVPSQDRFGGGMKALADYIHSKGLKFGIYQDWGNKTCQGYPGTLGHEESDIKQFVEWGVDYLKLDGCYSDIKAMDQGYPAYGQMLNKTGRPILYSCSWPDYQEEKNITANYTAIARSCNIWRNWMDVEKSWKSVLQIMDWFGDNQDRLIPHAGPGHFNDPDQLVIGFPELSVNASYGQMGVWAVLAAPLFMSTDLDTIKPEYKEVLLNKDIIAFNQDPLGKQGKRLKHKDGVDVWVREITTGKIYVFLERGDKKEGRKVYLTIDDLELRPTSYEVKDVLQNWANIMYFDAKSTITVTLSGSPGPKIFHFKEIDD